MVKTFLLSAGLTLASAQEASNSMMCGTTNVHYHSQQLTWDSAESFCNENYDSQSGLPVGGNLVAILDAATNDCVGKQLIPQSSNEQPWIGLTDDEPFSPTAQDWRWTSTGATAIQTFWNTNEPNPDSGERCVCQYGGGMGAIGTKWNNDMCSKTKTFVCMGAPKPTPAPGTPTPVPAPPPPTPDAAIPVTCTGREYVYHPSQMSWDAAETFCMTTYGGNLASINSLVQNTCVAGMIPGTDGQAWIGLTDDAPYSPQKMVWRWTDNIVTNAPYLNWNQGEPADSEERCGRMYGGLMGGAIAGTWNNDLCTKTAAFICIKPAPANPTPPPPPPTPSPGTICGGRIFHYHAQQLPWATAQSFCEETYQTAPEKGQLVSIHTAAENKCIADTVIPQGTDDQVWIGLTDDGYTSKDKLDFVWTDNSKSNYFNWNDGEPADSEERCGRMYGGAMGEIAGKWNNDLCSKTAAFVCQVAPGAAPKGKSSSAGEDAGIAIGVLALIGVAGGGVFWFRKRQQNSGLNTKFMTRHG